MTSQDAAGRAVVQPTGASIDDLRPAILLFHELVAAGIPHERLVMALCRILSAAEEEMARRYIETVQATFDAAADEVAATYPPAIVAGSAGTTSSGASLRPLWITARTILPWRVRFSPHQTAPPTTTASATSMKS